MLERVKEHAPGITGMIRLDHSHVMALFHRFKTDTAPARKHALVRNACLALEIHAQLEEEIFYPSLREASSIDPAVLDKSKPEHDEMRRCITELRSMRPGDPAFDQTFYQLIRDVMHHVADEETVLLPAAERDPSIDTVALGQRMTARRLQLLKPHMGELASTSVQSFPVVSALAGIGAIMLGTLLFRRPALR